MKKIIPLFIVLLFLAACASRQVPANPTPRPTPTVTPSPTALPTPSALGNAMDWGKLRVSLLQVEITDSYTNRFGSLVKPTQSRRFFWAQVQLENTGAENLPLPRAEHFSVLYTSLELKPVYGHRLDHPEYTALGESLFPGQQVSAWLRFDVPEAAQLPAIRFVFLPESSRVGVSASAPSYPWGGEHPVFLWDCSP